MKGSYLGALRHSHLKTICSLLALSVGYAMNNQLSFRLLQMVRTILSQFWRKLKWQDRCLQLRNVESIVASVVFARMASLRLWVSISSEQQLHRRTLGPSSSSRSVLLIRPFCVWWNQFPFAHTVRIVILKDVGFFLSAHRMSNPSCIMDFIQLR